MKRTKPVTMAERRRAEEFARGFMLYSRLCSQKKYKAMGECEIINDPESSDLRRANAAARLALLLSGDA